MTRAISNTSTPRGQKAVITYTEDGSQEVIRQEQQGPQYEVPDMGAAVAGEDDHTYLSAKGVTWSL